MTDMEMDPVDRITAGAVGPPGERRFYLQARDGLDVATVLVEKQQVQLLAASILEILARVGKETGQGPPEDQMELEEPFEPMWRAGRLSIGYQEERDLILLEIEELVATEGEGVAAEDPEGEPPTGLVPFEVHEEDPTEAAEEVEGMDGAEDLDLPQGERLRLWATREQMLSLSRHGALVASRGRPTCQFCGNPIDPEGHVCPAMNGHLEIGRE
jgi:uncharacterized repeat protein (TIGR03847 family)